MNKKKVILTTALLGSMIIGSSALVFATQDNLQKSILSGGVKLNNEEVRNSIVQVEKSESKLSEEQIVQLAEKYEKNVTKDTTMQIQVRSLEQGNTLKEDKYNDKKIWTVSDNYTETKIDAETGDLIQTLSKKQEYTDSNCTEDEAKVIANELYKNLDIKNEYKDYQLNGIIKFDDELWIANFSKKYGDLYNDFESVKVTFAPADKQVKIVSIINQGIYENNSVSISEDEAKDIAKKQINSNSNSKVKLAIVQPNYFFKDKNNYLTYKEVEKTRTAYIVSLEDENKTIVYVDATTGEVIGGDVAL
ncbi:MAG TPA: PepSY domain-containing protein [Clostridiaceae bacterium]|nr:PepSY domain-containing protein [Clostridiaceae bacterium]